MGVTNFEGWANIAFCQVGRREAKADEAGPMNTTCSFHQASIFPHRVLLVELTSRRGVVVVGGGRTPHWGH